MRFDFRKVSLMLLALLLLVPVIAACGGGGDSDDEETPGATAAQEDSTATSDETGSTETTDATEASDATATGDDGTPAADGTRTGGAEATATSSVPATVDPTIPTPLPTTPEPTRASSVDPTAGSAFAYGWNVAVRGDAEGGEHNDQVIGAVKDSGFGWVRFQLEWRQFERADNQWDPLPVDQIVDKFNSQGINVLIVVAKAPDWARDPNNNQYLADFGQFHELMAFLSDRYKGRVQAWEIWNEQNLAHEMGGTVRVEDYFELLKGGFQGVRTGDPDAKVLFGGLTPNGINDPAVAIDDVQYMELIYQYRNGEIAQYYDIMGAHVNSTHNPPDTMFPDNPGTEEGWNDDESFFFRRAEQLRQVMLKNGEDAKPMWITEFGWTTENQAPGYEYGANNTEEEVAEYLTRSLEIARDEWDFVSGAFVWNLNWSTLTTEEDEKFPWSALNADWSPRPAYEALTAFAKD